jgi:uncharacterized protein
MDGAYDQNGLLNQPHTDFPTSNDYVLKTAQTHPREFLAGVPINSQRRDAVEEVHRCADAGATLVKVVPNTQQFNFADLHYTAFYHALALRKLPFLSHVCCKFSSIGKDQSVGNQDRLREALEEGTTIIAGMLAGTISCTMRNYCRPFRTWPSATHISTPISPH